MSNNSPSYKDENRVTLHKGIFDFQINLLKNNSYKRMNALYKSCGIERLEDEYDLWIQALKKKVRIHCPEPKVDENGYSYIEAKNLVVDGYEVFERFAYRAFKTKKDNITEERFFVMLCHLAMYEYECDNEDYYDAIGCIISASCVYGTFGNLDSAKNIILSDAARNNGSKKGIKQKESVIAYMREILVSRSWRTQDDFFNRIEDDMEEGLCCKKSRGSIKTYFYNSIPENEKCKIERQPRRSKTIMSKS